MRKKDEIKLIWSIQRNMGAIVQHSYVDSKEVNQHVTWLQMRKEKILGIFQITLKKNGIKYVFRVHKRSHLFRESSQP